MSRPSTTPPSASAANEQAASTAPVGGYGSHGSSLRDLPRLRTSVRGRAASWDRTGGNSDFVIIEPGETAVLASIAGAGCIDHIWFALEVVGPGEPALDEHEPAFLRQAVLSAWWDDEGDPSICVPVGDFFGAIAPHPRQFSSLPMQVAPDGARSFSAWWHMPFADAARLELRNDLATSALRAYFYIDYQRFDRLDADLGRFHAMWNRENPAAGDAIEPASNREFHETGTNLTGKDNYVILDAAGHGHYVGCILSLHNLRESLAWNWYGEGDDMIFIDGAVWPPTLHGTGTEDYFGTAFCPREEWNAPYHGLISGGGENWSGVSTYYRFHIEDPITFLRDIRVTLEHGHANRRSDDIASVAFWYQAEPHVPFTLPAPSARMPRGRS